MKTRLALLAAASLPAGVVAFVLPGSRLPKSSCSTTTGTVTTTTTSTPRLAPLHVKADWFDRVPSAPEGADEGSMDDGMTSAQRHAQRKKEKDLAVAGDELRVAVRDAIWEMDDRIHGMLPYDEANAEADPMYFLNALQHTLEGFGSDTKATTDANGRVMSSSSSSSSTENEITAMINKEIAMISSSTHDVCSKAQSSAAAMQASLIAAVEEGVKQANSASATLSAATADAPQQLKESAAAVFTPVTTMASSSVAERPAAAVKKEAAPARAAAVAPAAKAVSTKTTATRFREESPTPRPAVKKSHSQRWVDERLPRSSTAAATTARRAPAAAAVVRPPTIPTPPTPTSPTPVKTTTVATPAITSTTSSKVGAAAATAGGIPPRKRRDEEREEEQRRRKKAEAARAQAQLQLQQQKQEIHPPAIKTLPPNVPAAPAAPAAVAAPVKAEEKKVVVPPTPAAPAAKPVVVAAAASVDAPPAAAAPAKKEVEKEPVLQVAAVAAPVKAEEKKVVVPPTPAAPAAKPVVVAAAASVDAPPAATAPAKRKVEKEPVLQIKTPAMPIEAAAKVIEDLSLSAPKTIKRMTTGADRARGVLVVDDDILFVSSPTGATTVQEAMKQAQAKAKITTHPTSTKAGITTAEDLLVVSSPPFPSTVPASIPPSLPPADDDLNPMPPVDRKSVEHILRDSKMAAVEEWHRTRSAEKDMSLEDKVLLVESRLVDEIRAGPSEAIMNYISILEKIGEHQAAPDTADGAAVSAGSWDLTYSSAPVSPFFSLPRLLARFLVGMSAKVEMGGKSVVYRAIFKFFDWFPRLRRTQKAVVRVSMDSPRKTVEVMSGRPRFTLGKLFSFVAPTLPSFGGGKKGSVPVEEPKLTNMCTYLGAHLKICRLTRTPGVSAEPLLAVFLRGKVAGKAGGRAKVGGEMMAEEEEELLMFGQGGVVGGNRNSGKLFGRYGKTPKGGRPSMA